MHDVSCITVSLKDSLPIFDRAPIKGNKVKKDLQSLMFHTLATTVKKGLPYFILWRLDTEVSNALVSYVHPSKFCYRKPTDAWPGSLISELYPLYPPPHPHRYYIDYNIISFARFCTPLLILQCFPRSSLEGLLLCSDPPSSISILYQTLMTTNIHHTHHSH